MSREEEDKRLEERLYWQKVGWAAHSLGLEPGLTDSAVLEHERKMRAKAQGLKTNASWFEVFCKEFNSGVVVSAPDYCECRETEWYDDPERAYEAADMAHKVYKPKKG